MRTLIASLLLQSLVAAAVAAKAAVPAYTTIDDAASELRDDFNAARGSVRLLFVIDPVCPACLRGLADIDEALLSRTDDPRLRTFVVHLPVIGAKPADVSPAATLLRNQHVRHYWQASGTFGRKLAAAVDLRGDKGLEYAWDVWLVYGPDASWENPLPPRPALLMHQLPNLRRSDFSMLDAEAFAREARHLLDRE